MLVEMEEEVCMAVVVVEVEAMVVAKVELVEEVVTKTNNAWPNVVQMAQIQWFLMRGKSRLCERKLNVCIMHRFHT
jgi:hypothetical protein